MDDIVQNLREEMEIPCPENTKRLAQTVKRILADKHGETHAESIGEGAKDVPDEQILQAVCVVMRVNEYDMSRNLLAEPDAQSFDFGIQCLVCDSALVMSKGMHDQYERLGRKLKVVCLNCVVKKGMEACNKLCEERLKDGSKARPDG